MNYATESRWIYRKILPPPKKIGAKVEPSFMLRPISSVCNTPEHARSGFLGQRLPNLHGRKTQKLPHKHRSRPAKPVALSRSGSNLERCLRGGWWSRAFHLCCAAVLVVEFGSGLSMLFQLKQPFRFDLSWQRFAFEFVCEMECFTAERK